MTGKNYRSKKLIIAIIIASIITLLLVFMFFYIVFWLRKEALNDSKKSAVLISKEITHTIELYFRDALTINKTYAGNFLLYKQNRIPRYNVYNLIKGSLNQNPNFLAIWTMWEPSAYDGNDKKYASDGIHDDKGSFSIAYYFDNNIIKQEINDTLDYLEDFYTIPSKIKKPIILDPFHYTYHGNPKSFYETSLVSPIMDKDKFLGVIGIDIDLDMLQKTFKDLNIYDHGFISILSNSGHIVTHPNQIYVDNNISKFLTKENQFIIDSLKTGKEFSINTYSEFINKKVTRHFYPINMEYMVAPWYIMVEIPQDEIFDYANKLRNISLTILLTIILLSGYLVQNFISREKAAKELSESEAYNKILFQDSRTPLIVMDSESHKYVDCNEAAVQIYGFKDKKELLGKTPIDVSTPEQYNGNSEEEAIKRIVEATKSGSLIFEWRHLRPNGEIWDAEVHLMLFQYKGKPMFQFSLLDITERKRNIEALKDSENQYHSLFENANDAIFVIEGNRFVDCNRRTLDMFGCDRNEIIGYEPYIYSPDLQPDGKASLDKALEKISLAFEGKPQFFEWQHKKLNGELFDAEVSLNLIQIKNKNYLLALVRDITSRKRNEEELDKHRHHLEEIVEQRTNEIAVLNEELMQSNEELQSINENLYNQKEELTNTLDKLREMQEQLVQSEKMASIGILTAGVAHEINNPLNFIQAGIYTLEMFLEKLGNNNLVKDNLMQIQKTMQNINIGISRVTEIVNSLGRFSRRSDDLNQICNINSIIDNCLVILNNTFKYKCTVTKEYCDEKLEVTGNEGKLHQVFINILNNSIQAIEKNGTLHISTNIAENNCALIIIRDNGSGILPEHINKIFDPFFTTKEPGKGTGLGLSIVYSIIKEHNGFITYKSEINRGTEVKILLPLRLK